MNEISHVSVTIAGPEVDVRGHSVEWTVELRAVDVEGLTVREESVPLDADVIDEVNGAVADEVQKLVGSTYVMDKSTLPDYTNDETGGDVKVEWDGTE
jgi:hypothetical protein